MVGRHAGAVVLAVASAAFVLQALGCLQVLGDDYKAVEEPPAHVDCDAKATCSECVDCATDQECHDVLLACVHSVDCQEYQGCVQPCEDLACYDDCDAAYPEGSAVFDDILVCTEQVCPSAC